MSKIIGLIKKVLSWVKVNGATIIAVIQTILKGIKEVLTGIVNLLSLFLSVEKAASIVKVVRNIINVCDSLLEKIKEKLIPKGA